MLRVASIKNHTRNRINITSCRNDERLYYSYIKGLITTFSELDEAKAILRTKLNYDNAYIESVRPLYNFSLSLDQSLILAMEDEARWLIASDFTSEKTVPNFLDYIYEDGLKVVKPDAVNIIH